MSDILGERFDAPNRLGREGEERVAKLFPGWRILRQPPGKAAGFDLEISTKIQGGVNAQELRRQGWQVLKAGDICYLEARLEVKVDAKAEQTCNIAVEMERDSNPSGIATSRADYWVYVVGEQALIFTIETLWALCDESPTKEGGDYDHPTTCAIIPLEVAKKWCKILPCPRIAQ
jgi:hypothetical protein